MLIMMYNKQRWGAFMSLKIVTGVFSAMLLGAVVVLIIMDRSAWAIGFFVIGTFLGTTNLLLIAFEKRIADKVDSMATKNYPSLNGR